VTTVEPHCKIEKNKNQKTQTKDKQNPIVGKKKQKH
jgi:hypothetical protein